ncbi:DUF2304 family protein [archaeon]|nr:DUF2304 family protein [archaeon]
MEVIQIIILIFGLFALSRVFTNLSHKNLEKIEAIFWMLFWTVVIFIAIFPETISSAAKILGVKRGVDLAIYFSIVVLSYLIFRLYAQISNIEKNITKIIRTVAIKK